MLPCSVRGLREAEVWVLQEEGRRSIVRGDKHGASKAAFARGGEGEEILVLERLRYKQD